MSLQTMTRRMQLEVPNLADQYCRTLLDEALGRIEDTQMWSFQLLENGWLTPGLQFPAGPGVSAGTITVKPFTNTITGDANASAAWAAYVAPPFLTSFQIRSPFYSLYNIVAYNVVGGFGQFTIDRPWMEPGGTKQPYMIYQAYFPTPFPDFKRFIAARDTTNSLAMNYWSLSQKDLAFKDPERTIFDDPQFIVPYQVDNRAGSATLGNMLYELWPHPLDILPYTYNYMRRGPRLSKPADTVPYPLTEECVLWRAKEAAYSFKEAQKGENLARGSGADFRFLAQAANAEYKAALKPCKDKDRDMVDLYMDKFRSDQYEIGVPYSNQDGSLNIGRM